MSWHIPRIQKDLLKARAASVARGLATSFHPILNNTATQDAIRCLARPTPLARPYVPRRPMAANTLTQRGFVADSGATLSEYSFRLLELRPCRWGYRNQAAPPDIELRLPPRDTIGKECARPDEEPQGVAQGDEPPSSAQERVFQSVRADGESHGEASRQGNAQVAYCRDTRRRHRGCRERPGQALRKQKSRVSPVPAVVCDHTPAPVMLEKLPCRA